jgi:hypothetical protein
VNPSISTSYIVESNLNSSCTNRDTILVTVLTATIPIITQVGYNLTTTTGYVSYQWFNNNSAITNQTNNTFTPTSSGDYYVMVVDSNGCQTQSAVYNFVYVGELELASVAEIILMPNPANNFVLLSATNNKNLNGTLKVSSVNGDLMLEKNLVNSNQFKIDIEQWANGMYTLELIRETKSERIKFIKQQ